MSASISASTNAPLLFNWEGPRRRKLAIAGFLIASVIAHAACFYVFQIVYPPTVSLLPPPARVSLISSVSEEGRTLLRWVEAEDPALASTTLPSPETRTYALPKVVHVPSYSGYEPALKQASPLVVDLSIPSAQPPASVPIVRTRTALAATKTPTSIMFSKEIENLGPASLPAMTFAASTGEPPESIRFHIGVGPRGDIRYCFPLNSSGDPALDEAARQYLALCRFPTRSTADTKTGDALVWGTATIEWGNDVARPPAPAPTTTTP
jgi:hypothetical protein